MVFMTLKLITTILTFSLFIVTMSEFIKTRKLRKLSYPLIVIYFLVGMPIIEGFIHNRVHHIWFAVLSFAVSMIFIYKDLIITYNEKKLMH